MDHIDLTPAARRLADLVAGVPDEQLGGPTPCADYTVGELVDHIGGLALAFRWAADTDLGAAGDSAPSADAARLGDDWRSRIPRDLVELAEAWRAPAAWTGMTRAGGVDLPGEVAGLVALDELVVHAWDLARATGQHYECDEPTLGPCTASSLSSPAPARRRHGLGCSARRCRCRRARRCSTGSSA